MVVQFEIANILMISYRRKYKIKCEDQDEDTRPLGLSEY